MENKDKIAELKAEIVRLKNMLKEKNSSEKEEAILAKIAEYEAQIKKITDIGNGDGTGRKPISAMLRKPSPRGKPRPASY